MTFNIEAKVSFSFASLFFSLTRKGQREEKKRSDVALGVTQSLQSKQRLTGNTEEVTVRAPQFSSCQSTKLLKEEREGEEVRTLGYSDQTNQFLTKFTTKELPTFLRFKNDPVFHAHAAQFKPQLALGCNLCVMETWECALRCSPGIFLDNLSQQGRHTCPLSLCLPGALSRSRRKRETKAERERESRKHMNSLSLNESRSSTKYCQLQIQPLDKATQMYSWTNQIRAPTNLRIFFPKHHNSA